LQDDTLIHTAKLNEREKSTVRNSASNLGTPTCVTICQEGGCIGWLWWDCIFIGLNVLGGRREVDERMHRGDVLRCKGYLVIMGGMDLVECVEGCFHMPNQSFVVVRQQERMGRCKIRTSGARKTTNTSN
jgi:hypothetical protein